MRRIDCTNKSQSNQGFMELPNTMNKQKTRTTLFTTKVIDAQTSLTTGRIYL
jgi:hypothetical protein